MKTADSRETWAGSIKVVVITMFEPGGGQEGELTRLRRSLRLQPWQLAGFPRGTLYRNNAGVAALVAGVGPVNTALSVLKLGLSDGTDWRKTYWLVAGIAGGNPKVCSLGSPVFAEWVVDGDLAMDIHPADCPKRWSTGILPIGAKVPFGKRNTASGLFGKPAQVFRLDSKLARWAWHKAQEVELYDSANLASARQSHWMFKYGARQPYVELGDVLSAARFWHGKKHQSWAEKWLLYWTKGKGQFATASMEDSGTLGALHQLHRMHRVNWQRVLVMRSVSNYTLPPPGKPACDHLQTDSGLAYPGMEAAFENGLRVGQVIIRALLEK